VASFSGMGEIKQEPSENDDDNCDSLLNWPINAEEESTARSTNNYGDEFQMLKWQMKNTDNKSIRQDLRDLL
jgi:hypothetical protein